MGMWGTGLYQNDTAADTRAVFEDLSRKPLDTDTLVRRVADRLGAGSDPTSEDAVDVWLALADQLHLHALDDAETRPAVARAPVVDDLAALRRLVGAPRLPGLGRPAPGARRGRLRGGPDQDRSGLIQAEKVPDPASI